MKRTLLAAALLVATAAHASFTGAFDPVNWLPSEGTGSINTFNANDLSMTSGNDDSGSDSNTEVTIELQEGGTISFAWFYTTTDQDGPFFDPFFVLRPSLDQLSDSNGNDIQDGVISFSANAGDVIGFRIRTTDNSAGSAGVRITDFNFVEDRVNPAPEPGGIALLGVALLAGFAGQRKLNGARAAA